MSNKQSIQSVITKEKNLWKGAMESSLDFWNDKSNDVYEKLLSGN